jgi:hypothetical protein
MLCGLEEAYKALGTLEGRLLRKAFDAIEGQLRCYRSRAFDLPATAACRTSLVLSILAGEVADRRENPLYSSLKQ